MLSPFFPLINDGWFPERTPVRSFPLEFGERGGHYGGVCDAGGGGDLGSCLAAHALSGGARQISA